MEISAQCPDGELTEKDQGVEHAAAIELQNQLGHWPRRLLHVPTMRSLEWNSGNRYGDSIEPKYNAISYTWGRWCLQPDQFPQVQSIDVHGVSWRIPRVHPDHFDPATLKAVIEQARTAEPKSPFNFSDGEDDEIVEVDYVWIDIACIDQNFNLTSMLEIGRQAEIFGGARSVYVWLSHTSTPELREVRNFASSWDPYYPDFEPFGPASGIPDRWPQVETVLDCLRKEPWFSSVWTLQEAYLRKDAVFLSRNAQKLYRIDGSWNLSEEGTVESEFSFGLGALLLAAETVSLSSARLPPASALQDMVQQTINDLGMKALNRNDPMGLYAVAHRRKPSNDLDSVYGIQQIFGLRLGLSSPTADPRRNFTLDELEDELGEALLVADPVLSQGFVHTDASIELGKRWRVSRSAVVPEPLFNDDNPWRSSLYTPVCAMFTENVLGKRMGSFKGKMCSFAHLQRIWAFMHEQESQMEGQPVMWLMLDNAPDITPAIVESSLGEHPPQPGAFQSELHSHRKSGILANSFGEEALKVLHLGAHTSSPGAECHFGLILLQGQMNKSTLWRRIGVCTWRGYASSAWGLANGLFKRQSIPFALRGTSSSSSTLTRYGDDLVHPNKELFEPFKGDLSGESHAWKAVSGLFG